MTTTAALTRPRLCSSADELYAVLLDGTLKQSADGGKTWTDRVKPPA